MDILQAMKERHSVRSYTKEIIGDAIRKDLDAYVAELNEESGLHMEIVYDDPNGFDLKLINYGVFQNVYNYIVFAGPADLEDLEEKCGYYGEKLVIRAQQLGLRTCWVGASYNKRFVKKTIKEGDKLVLASALGYGANDGHTHKSKSPAQVVATKGAMPIWFAEGVEAALLAPTAINQQKFKIGMKNGEPKVVASGFGPYVKVDLGIVKYHFEIGTGGKYKPEFR